MIGGNELRITDARSRSMSDIQHVKCTKCDVPFDGPVIDGEPEGTFVCPVSGENDSIENVMREVGEYVRDKAREHIAGTFEKAPRGNKYVSFR